MTSVVSPPERSTWDEDMIVLIPHITNTATIAVPAMKMMFRCLFMNEDSTMLMFDLVGLVSSSRGVALSPILYPL